MISQARQVRRKVQTTYFAVPTSAIRISDQQMPVYQKIVLTNEEQKDPKFDFTIVYKSIVYTFTDCSSEGEWNSHSKEGDGASSPNISSEEGEVDFQSYEEQEEN